MYIKTLFLLIGNDSSTAQKKSQLVYDVEKQMAESHKTNVELRDRESNYHKMSVSQHDKEMPAITWRTTLKSTNDHADD